MIFFKIIISIFYIYLKIIVYIEKNSYYNYIKIAKNNYKYKQYKNKNINMYICSYIYKHFLSILKIEIIFVI